MEFLEAFNQFFFGTGVIPEEYNKPRLVFAAASAAMGFMVVVLDVFVYSLRKQSVLGLDHTWTQTPIFLIFWGMGAGIGGFVGCSFEIFVLNIKASVAAGVSWPFILPTIYQNVSEVVAGRDVQLPSEE